MLAIGKWNYDTHTYDQYVPDPNWNIVLYSDDMGLKINCTSCGKKMTFGNAYTSKELHNFIGLGFPVCEDCYAVEIERWEKHRDDPEL